MLNTIFVFSHALPRDIGQTADARPQFRPQIPGWVITTRCRVPLCRQREHENSTTIRVGKGTTCFCCRLYSHRRRLKSRVISLSAVGIEDLSASIDSGGGSDPSTQLAVCTSEDTTEVAEVADCVNEGEAIFERIKAIARDFEVDGHRVRLQVATLDDYHAVADVRFSVFSPVHMTLRQRFRERSCMLMKERRHRGAFCLVAVSETIDVEFNAPKDKDEIAEGSDGRGKGLAVGRGTQILGTVECSKHEFEETPLALDEGISRCVSLNIDRRASSEINQVATNCACHFFVVATLEIAIVLTTQYSYCIEQNLSPQRRLC